MAILIPDMDMPENCMECDLQYDMCACILTGTRFWTKDTFDPAVERLPDCPLKKVNTLPYEQWKQEILDGIHEVDLPKQMVFCKGCERIEQ